MRLAIIGGGMGGCSAAYFCKKLLPDAEVTIYERRRLGGRILTQDMGERKRELGAVFYHPSNRTVQGLIDELGLKRRDIGGLSSMGVWNGERLIFRSSRSQLLTKLALASRYGHGLSRLVHLVAELKKRVQRLYQEAEKNPGDLGVLFESAGLLEWMGRPLREILLEARMSPAFMDEAVEPLIRLIYGQGAEVEGFAGLSSLIEVDGAPLYRVEGGNVSLPGRLAEASSALLRMGHGVEKIEAASRGSYRVEGRGFSGEYDAVIISTPLESAGLELKGVPTIKLGLREFQSAHVEIVRGEINPRYFGVDSSGEIPRFVLTTPDASFSHLQMMWREPDGGSLYGVSSTSPLSPGDLDEIFLRRETILNHAWSHAYPVFKPVRELHPTRLGENLYYVNAVESAASSMESSAFSALNAVRLLKRDVAGA